MVKNVGPELKSRVGDRTVYTEPKQRTHKVFVESVVEHADAMTVSDRLLDMLNTPCSVTLLTFDD